MEIFMDPNVPLKDEHSLIIVSGKWLVKMYEYNNGKITPQPVVHVEHVIYTDSEGFRAPNRNSNVNGTPSNYESHNKGEWDYFVKDFEAKAAELMQNHEFEAIYLFAPQEVISQVREILPREWQERLVFEYSGNFTKAMPAELTEIIKSEYEKETKRQREKDPTNWTERASEAKHILRIPKVNKGSV
jgi:hypothetical protein